MKKTLCVLVAALTLMGCAILSAKTPIEKAKAACTDLQAIAGTTRLFVTAAAPFVPPERKAYVSELLPALDRVDAGVAAYCTAADLAVSTDNLAALAGKAQEVKDLAAYLWTAIYGARFNAISQPS